MLREIASAVMVSGSGTNLQALIDAKSAGFMPHVGLRLAVSSKPGAAALLRAAKGGLDTAVVDRRMYGGDIVSFERAMLAVLRDNGIEFIILAGFLTIFSEEFTKLYEDRIINVHPALIPSFCGRGFYGLRVHEAALRRGVKVSGATVHFVNGTPDGGRIISQKAVDVLPDDTPLTLQQRIMRQAEWVLLPAAAEVVCRQIADNCPDKLEEGVGRLCIEDE